MIMMQGNDRIFDKVVTEGGTATARTISLYGVKALSDLQGISLVVRANIGGSNSATTMKVNNLAATKLSVFKNGGIVDADADWIVSGQLYMLYYDGVQFIAFPMSASSESSSSSVEFADFSIEVLNLDSQSSESDISSAFGGAAKTAEFDALVQAGTKIIRFTNVDSFVYYTALYYKHINVENSTINDIVIVLHNYTDRTDLEVFTFIGTMTEDGDFEKYTAVAKRTLYSSSQEGTLDNPRAFTGDANTKTTPGVYAITPFSNVPNNIPSGVSYGTMIVTTDEDASTITQTLQTSNTVYFRCKYSTNSWGDWVDLGASGGGSSSEGMKTFEITYDDLEDILNAKSESAILAIWNDTEQSEFVEAMNDPNTIIVIKYTDDQYITDRQYVVYKTGFYNGIGYSVAQTQYINLITVTGSYLYNYKFNFNFDTEHISSVTRSSIDLSKIEDEMIVETDQATSLSFDNQTGNRGILAVSGNQEQKTSEQGKNYFTGNKIASGTEKGVTYSFDNSIFKMNGTTTSSGNIILDAPTGVRLPAGTYTWTIKVSSGNYQRPAETDFAFYLRNANDYITGELGSSGITLSSINNNIYSINFTITEETEIYLRIFANAANIVFNDLELQIQIESGSEYTEFEQFIPNMPSPDYLSPVKCLGSNKQLFDKSTAVEGLLQEDGTLSYSDNKYSTSDFIKVVPKKSYYKTITGSNRFKFFDEDKSPISSTYNDLIEPTKAQSFEIPENAHYIRFTFLKTYIDEIKIEEGTEATSYSPYGQGSTLISKINKNLLSMSNLENGGYTSGVAGQSLSKVGNATRVRLNIPIKVYANTKYSFKLQTSKLLRYNILEVGEDNIIKKVTSVTNTNSTTLITTSETAYVTFLFLWQTTTQNITIDDLQDCKIQFEIGVETEYEEHQEESYILDIQQEMLQGDYFVKEADVWKEVHSYPKKIFDGTESWRMPATDEENAVFCNLSNTTIYDYASDTDEQLSTHFVWGGKKSGFQAALNSGVGIYTYIENNNKYVYFVVPLSIASTIEEWTTWLQTINSSGKPLTNYYKSATPTKLPCTEEQSEVLDELNSLTMEFGENNVITLENIALLQMTLVDSQLNDVIEASIPIVNSDFIVLSSAVLYLTPDSTQDEITAAFGGLENEEKVLRELSAGNKSLKIAAEYNGDTCGAVEVIWYEVGPVANDFNFVYIMNGYLVYKCIYCDSGPRSLDYNDQFYPLSQVYRIERVKLYGTASSPEELSYNRDFNSIITPGIYKADQSEGRINAPCKNPGTLIVGASEGEYRGNARDNCIIQFYIASHCRLDEIDYSSGIYFRSYAFDGIKNTQYWTDWVNLLDNSSEVGTILNPNILTSIDDLDNIKTSGTYTYTTSSSPNNTPNGTSYGTLIVNKISDKEITQTVISPDFSEGSSSKSSNIWFRNYGTRDSNQQSGVPEWSNWNMLLMTDYGNKYRYIKPYLLSYYKFDSLNSDSTQTDIENAFGSLENEQEFIAAMNDENTNIILYYDHESNEREYWYTISKMADNGNYHRLILCSGNSSESMTAGSISFIVYTFSYDDTNNVYTAFSKYKVTVPSKGTIINANGLYSGSTDMNSLYEPGVSNIRADSSLQNYPAGAGTGTLLTFAISNLYIIQMLITSTYLEASNPIKVYSRGCQTNLDGVPSDDTWSEWQEWSINANNETEIVYIPDTIYGLNNSSTQTEIEAAFGGVDEIQTITKFIAKNLEIESFENNNMLFKSSNPSFLRLKGSTKNYNSITYSTYTNFNSIYLNVYSNGEYDKIEYRFLYNNDLGQNELSLRGPKASDGLYVTTFDECYTDFKYFLSEYEEEKLDGIEEGATANSASTTTPKANGTAAVGTDTGFARGDHVHPAQTTITGNAGSATKLQTARTINGVAFNGTANINTFDSSYKIPGCYRMKSDSNPSLNMPGGNNFIPLEAFPMYSELGTNPLFTLNSDGTITVNKTCMLDFRGTWSVYGSGNTSNKIYSNITYYDSDMQAWMPLYSSPLVPTSTMEMTSYDADFGPGQMSMVMAGTKIRASLDSTNDTSGAVFSGQINGYSLFINVIYVKG